MKTSPSFPPHIQEKLQQIRVVIREAAPLAMEKISYQMPGYFQEGVLIWFAAFNKHISIFPRSKAEDSAFPELSGYKGTKGSIHFPLDQDIPYELIRRIVQFRVEQKRKQ